MPKITGTLISLFAALALAAGSAACSGGSGQSGGSGPSGGPASSTGSATASQTPPGSSASPSGSATEANCPSGTWQPGPVTVTRQLPTPPVPMAAAITTGSHPDCKFDRLVITISGPLPGYDATFVTSVIQDGSGMTMSLPGTRFLVLHLRPAQGHVTSGKSTVPRQLQKPGYPMLNSYVVSGDFEGVFSIALGLNGGTKFRIGELSDRIYIDVAW